MFPSCLPEKFKQISLILLKTAQTFENKRMKRRLTRKPYQSLQGCLYAFFFFFLPINFPEKSPSLCQREGVVAILTPQGSGLLLNRCHQHSASVATSNMPLATVSWPGQLADPFAMLCWINYGLWPSVPWNMSGCCAHLIPLLSQPTCSTDVFF